MKKIIYFLAAVTLFAVGCAKEQPINDKVENPTTSSNGKVTLTATMPNFIDDATKASIADNGAFSWDDKDVIQVKYWDPTNHSYVLYYHFSCNNPDDGIFECDQIQDNVVIASEGTVAWYPIAPAAGYYYYDLSTGINPATQFVMEANVDSDGKLAFEHKSALMKVTLKNVPSFAKHIYINAVGYESTQIENMNLSSNQASLTYYVPVRPTSEAKKLHIQVKDENYQIIFEKTTSGEVQIQAGHLYVLPDLEIGHILSFYNKDAAYGGNSDSSIYIWEVGGSKTHNQTSARNTYTSGGKTYEYVVMPSNWGELTRTAVKYEGSGGSTETRVFLDRNIVFNVATNKISTTYRVYLSKDSSFSYSDIYAYDGVKLGAWPGTEMSASGSLKYVEIDESLYAQTVRLWFNTGSGGIQTPDENTWSFTNNMDQRATIYKYNEYGDKLSIGLVYGWD